MRLVYRDRMRGDSFEKQDKYFRVGAMPLSEYIYMLPPREKLPQWRSFWDRRKPWKTVRAGWMEHVLREMGHELHYTGKEAEPVRWTVKWRKFYPSSHYSDNNINDMINLDPLVDGMYAKLHSYDYSFMTKRKPWKRFTEVGVAIVVHNLGGMIVD